MDAGLGRHRRAAADGGGAAERVRRLRHRRRDGGRRLGGAEGDYVIIRDLMLVEAFTALFDLAWSTGLPVPDAASTSESDRRLLALLARGYKDEAIARYLGWGVRTVRRRVSALMDAFGADTRFQLGVAAQQRGLLEVEAPARR